MFGAYPAGGLPWALAQIRTQTPPSEPSYRRGLGPLAYAGSSERRPHGEALDWFKLCTRLVTFLTEIRDMLFDVCHFTVSIDPGMSAHGVASFSAGVFSNSAY